MPRPRKVFFNDSVAFLTTSVEEGLLFPSNPLIKLLIESALGRAQELYDVEVNHKLIEPTHVHLVVTIHNPDDVKGFMERFKTESAHYINRLLGRGKRTVWCEGYDSPILLTKEDVMRIIAYIYSNPSNDALEDTIDNYPHISSWKDFRRTIATNNSLDVKIVKKVPWIRRSMIAPLKSLATALHRLKEIADDLLAKAKEFHTFTIKPNGWMKCFGITDPKEIEEINREIVQMVRNTEKENREARKKENKRVIGAKRLVTAPINPFYRPQRTGRRMLCICHDKKIRRQFINTVKDLIERAKRVYRLWMLGDFSLKYPPGLYPPSFPKLANLLGVHAMY